MSDNIDYNNPPEWLIPALEDYEKAGQKRTFDISPERYERLVQSVIDTYLTEPHTENSGQNRTGPVDYEAQNKLIAILLMIIKKQRYAMEKQGVTLKTAKQPKPKLTEEEEQRARLAKIISSPQYQSIREAIRKKANKLRPENLE